MIAEKKWNQRLALGILLAKLGITQSELAKKSQVSDVTVSHWMSDRSVLNVSKIQLFLDGTEISMSEFIGWGE
jgi:transcriptional regulator with XRE-family HTH domain